MKLTTLTTFQDVSEQSKEKSAFRKAMKRFEYVGDTSDFLLIPDVDSGRMIVMNLEDDLGDTVAMCRYIEALLNK
jgi:hypothetical protein